MVVQATAATEPDLIFHVFTLGNSLLAEAEVLEGCDSEGLSMFLCICHEVDGHLVLRPLFIYQCLTNEQVN